MVLAKLGLKGLGLESCRFRALRRPAQEGRFFGFCDYFLQVIPRERLDATVEKLPVDLVQPLAPQSPAVCRAVA